MGHYYMDMVHHYGIGQQQQKSLRLRFLGHLRHFMGQNIVFWAKWPCPFPLSSSSELAITIKDLAICFPATLPLPAHWARANCIFIRRRRVSCCVLRGISGSLPPSPADGWRGLHYTNTCLWERKSWEKANQRGRKKSKIGEGRGGGRGKRK